MTDALGAWLEAAGRAPLLTAAEEIHLGTAVRRWQDWPDGPDAAPADVRRRGLRARERMVRGNLRLVVAVTKKYTTAAQRLGLPLVDGLQEGAIGLQRGAEKFDPATGYKLSTYAYWWIRQAVTRWLNGSGGVIRLPVNVAERLLTLTPAELQAMPRAKRDRFLAAIAAQRVGRLDAPICGGDDDSTLLGDLVAADAPDPLEALHWAMEARRVAATRCRPQMA